MGSEWMLPTFILCLFGFLKELRPSEPYLTEYLVDPKWVNITEEQAYQDVYPVWTYSYLSILVIVFLLTDYLRYKPLIILEGFSYIATWSLLLWGSGVPLMQLMQFFYGVATSTEVAYFTYIYNQVDSIHYRKVTSLTRASLLSGRFLSGVLSQVLLSTSLLTFRTLNYFSFVTVTSCTIISFFLPSVKHSLYFHRETSESLSSSSSFANSLLFIMKDFKTSFSHPIVLKWSLWWALASAGNYQVGNYIQSLWKVIQPDSNEIYNGGVEALSTLLGALLSLSLGCIKLNWKILGEPLLALMSFLQGALLLIMSSSSLLFVVYGCYLVYSAVFQMLITIVSFEIASSIQKDSHGLIFGFNTFMALFLQTLLTLIVVEENVGFQLKPRDQFTVYGCCWFGIGILFTVTALFLIFSSNTREHYKQNGIWQREEILKTESDVVVQ